MLGQGIALYEMEANLKNYRSDYIQCNRKYRGFCSRGMEKMDAQSSHSRCDEYRIFCPLSFL